MSATRSFLQTESMQESQQVMYDMVCCFSTCFWFLISGVRAHVFVRVAHTKMLVAYAVKATGGCHQGAKLVKDRVFYLLEETRLLIKSRLNCSI